LLGLGIDPSGVLTGHVAHHVEVVRRQVDHHAHVADAAGEGADAAADDLEDAAQLARIEMLLERLDRGIEAHDVTHHQLTVCVMCGVDQCTGLRHRGGDGLLDQDVGPGSQGCLGNLSVVACRHRDRHQVRTLRVQHLAVVCVASAAVLGADTRAALG